MNEYVYIAIGLGAVNLILLGVIACLVVELYQRIPLTGSSPQQETLDWIPLIGETPNGRPLTGDP